MYKKTDYYKTTHKPFLAMRFDKGNFGEWSISQDWRKYDRKRGLRIDQVVEATGISKRTIITIENEEGANPSVDTVKRLIKYFEISFEELYPW